MHLTITQRCVLLCLLPGLALVASARGAEAQAHPAAREDPFARHAWNLELGGHVAVETWNYNISHETMYGTWQGFTYGLRKGLALKTSWPLYFVDQRGVDPYLLGATLGVRGRVAGSVRAAIFWEVDVGVSKAESHTPPHGTQFNYLALGAIGVSARVAPRTHLLASLRWAHVSNNGIAGRHRNPDIEAIGPQLGVLLGF
jgi:hypothetical protein